MLNAPAAADEDLEFQRAENPGADGAAAVDALLALLGELLREKFGLGWEPR